MWLLRMTARNLMVAGAVFVPGFMAGMTFANAVLLGGPVLSRGIGDYAGGVVLLFIGLAFPVVIGVLAHTAALGVIRMTWPQARLPTAALVLAPLVPGSPMVLQVPGWIMFTAIPGTAIATLAYGIVSAARMASGNGVELSPPTAIATDKRAGATLSEAAPGTLPERLLRLDLWGSVRIVFSASAASVVLLGFTLRVPSVVGEWAFLSTATLAMGTALALAYRSWFLIARAPGWVGRLERALWVVACAVGGVIAVVGVRGLL